MQNEYILVIDADLEDIDSGFPMEQETRSHSHLLYYIWSRVARRYPYANKPRSKVRYDKRDLIPLHQEAAKQLTLRVLRYLDLYGRDLSAYALLDALNDADWDTVDRILQGGELVALALR